MRIAVGSDLHLEFGPIVLNNAGHADVLILAGDICIARDFELADKNLYAENKRAQRYLEFFQDVAEKFKTVLYVPGNHEHYNGDFKYTYGILKRALAHLPNIHVLDKETFLQDDVTFIGGTMWTNCNNEDPITIGHVKLNMNDFREVNNSHNMVSRKVPLYDNENFETNSEGYVVRNPIGYKFKEIPSKFTPQDSIEDHRKMVDYINNVVAEKDDKKFVVVTHHTPSWQSCSERFRYDTLMNGAFHTELGDFIAYRPQIKLWIHGHTHDDFDYEIGETRVVCNPRGYMGYERRTLGYDLKYIDIV